jgi:hypothetical protein
MKRNKFHDPFIRWRKPGGWKLFAREILQVNLDPEQEQILDSVQVNKMTTVASGTARGKDFVSAVAALCFFYLTPKWKNGELIENTKVAMTAPTGRQVSNIMMPEVARIFRRARFLHGKLLTDGIRTESEEWFLTGFKADEHNHEAWSGFHAVNTMFIVTEASGIAVDTFSAIEGNLQGESRLLIVFNPNNSIGYAADSFKSPRFHKFRLDSLTAPNVIHRKNIYPGQVDYHWILDKVNTWCERIAPHEFNDGEGDFIFDGVTYRPNDLFRVKVRGMFPKESEDKLIPLHWIELAQKRREEWMNAGLKPEGQLRLGCDVAGMGRDANVFVSRQNNFVTDITKFFGNNQMIHMEVAGKINNVLRANYNEFNGTYGQAFIDTIGEGAGVYSRLIELGEKPGHDHLSDKIYSVKYSEGAKQGDTPLKDATEIYTFLNMRAYLFWAVRDWLNPALGSKAMLPKDDELTQELTEVMYKFRSDGKIQIEPKEDIKSRLKRSPDKMDALANTFYPVPDLPTTKAKKGDNAANFFF